MSKVEKAIESLRLAITSGNDVPVRRATVSADDLEVVLNFASANISTSVPPLHHLTPPHRNPVSCPRNDGNTNFNHEGL